MMTIQKQVQEFVTTQQLETSVELRMLDLLSELGELSKELLKAGNYGAKPYQISEAIADELGDVGFSLLCIANQMNLDLATCVERSLKKYSSRIASKGSISSES